MEKGEDFEAKPETIRVMAYAQGSKRDLFVRCAITEDGNVVIHATPMTEQQLEARKERAEKRAAGKAVAPVEGEVTAEQVAQAEAEATPEPEPVKPAAKVPAKPTIANKSKGKNGK